MGQKLPAFIMIDALVSLSISLLIISTLAITIDDGFKILHQREETVNAKRLMLQALSDKNFPDSVKINSRRFHIVHQEHSIRVHPEGGNYYQASWQ